MKIIKEYARSALRSIRIESKSNLFWWKGPPLNFGDWIGPYLFKKLSGFDPTYKVPSNKSIKSVYITVGSCARWFCEDSIVWGSGIIEKDETFWKPKKVCSVRGHYTRQRMQEQGYDCPEVYGDPAILLQDLYNPSMLKDYRMGVIPHYCNIEEAKSIFSGINSVNVIDVRTRNVEHVVQEIKKCETILSSSLHGLILGNAYSIPSAQVEFTSKLGGDGVKFLDYFSAFDVIPPPPITVRDWSETKNLESFIKNYPQPNAEELKPKLYEACPFYFSKKGS